MKNYIFCFYRNGEIILSAFFTKKDPLVGMYKFINILKERGFEPSKGQIKYSCPN